ncbi:OLC1v1002023C1 [Oldenlandia corymbosa var. corymbosa]|uniref:OLC1v1002023C1 n=1 Tax=Oldenlandia corymbosa var. corymbosa TaxID=529605 RepID=A0AAV1D959_OLDCO|nr:OLC1v1002023C1 [Oldenlandia corymbosa var. corymbosa]
MFCSFAAEKCRELVGKEAASKSGEFTFLNCFDGSSGTLACLVKEGVKLYSYSIRSFHVEGARNKAIEAALADALSQGLDAKAAAKLAQKEGAKAAKLATRKVKRVVGPIISSGWDFFEALYFGGTITEGFLRGTGTLFGTYAVGYVGEERFGRVGYLLGSHLGSWIGGRIGLMVYDVVSGVHVLLQVSQSVETKVKNHITNEVYVSSTFETSEAQEESYVSERPSYSSDESGSEASEEPAFTSSESSPEAPQDSSHVNDEGSAEVPEDSSVPDTPVDMSSYASEETTVDDETFEGDNSEVFEEL